jgi:hypothetical protein
MRAERVYVVSILLGLAVAGLVGWQILSARDTDCFLRSIKIQIAQPAKSKHKKPLTELLEGCIPKTDKAKDKGKVIRPGFVGG